MPPLGPDVRPRREDEASGSGSIDGGRSLKRPRSLPKADRCAGDPDTPQSPGRTVVPACGRNLRTRSRPPQTAAVRLRGVPGERNLDPPPKHGTMDHSIRARCAPCLRFTGAAWREPGTWREPSYILRAVHPVPLGAPDYAIGRPTRPSSPSSRPRRSSPLRSSARRRTRRSRSSGRATSRRTSRCSTRR